MICGFYRMTPAEAGQLTPGETRTLLDGIDWVSDQEWKRALFVRTQDARAARDLFDLNYPHFRVEAKRIVKISRAPGRRQIRHG